MACRSWGLVGAGDAPPLPYWDRPRGSCSRCVDVHLPPTPQGRFSITPRMAPSATGRSVALTERWRSTSTSACPPYHPFPPRHLPPRPLSSPPPRPPPPRQPPAQVRPRTMHPVAPRAPAFPRTLSSVEKSLLGAGAWPVWQGLISVMGREDADMPLNSANKCPLGPQPCELRCQHHNHIPEPRPQ